MIEILEKLGEDGEQSVYLYYFPSDKQGDRWPCKIGRTSGDPKRRVARQQASMRERPVIGLVIKTDDGTALERSIHLALAAKRLDTFGREWFQTSPAEVKAVFAAIERTEAQRPLEERRYRGPPGLKRTEVAASVKPAFARSEYRSPSPRSFALRQVISLENLSEVAARTGFQAATIERVVRLMDILNDIRQDEIIGNKVALKGGTALNLYHLDLARLSVDIDLNYIGSADREETLKDKALLDRRIPALLTRLGYSVKRDATGEHAGGKWRFGYTSAFERPGTLEIDLNYMYRVPFFGTTEVSSVELAGHQATGTRLIDLHELVGGKLVALANRRATRDVFDAWRLATVPGIDWKRVQNTMVVIGAAGRNADWREASIAGYDFDLNELNGKLITCLPRHLIGKERSAADWCDQVVSESKQALGHLYEITDAQRAFLDTLYEEGRIDASLLDADDDFRQRVELFPALRWKANNIVAHLAKDAAPRM